jgi:hypothetical protein
MRSHLETRGMLLSDSFESDLSHTSILYYSSIICRENILRFDSATRVYQEIYVLHHRYRYRCRNPKCPFPYLLTIQGTRLIQPL